MKVSESIQRVGKRGIDLVGSIFGLLVASPVMIPTALAIRITMGRPIFFRQVRPGLKGVPFTLIKFRTMRNLKGPGGEALPDAERLTGLGRFLRKSSLDELPELWNVVKGDMSLVGPRPLLMGYLSVYSPEQARRHEVRPGITGLAQISGRQDIPFSRRLELDVWYVDHWSVGLDLKILMLTIVRMIRTTGVRPGQDVRDVDDLGLSQSSGTRQESL